MAENEWIEVLDPTRTVKEAAGADRLAPRPATLDGAVVGLISNGKGQSARLVDAVYRELAATAAVAGSVVVHKSAFYAPPSDDEWRRLHEGVDVVVAALGG